MTHDNIIDIDMLPEPKRLMLAGDWHHDTSIATRTIEQAAEMEVDTILQLGDLGFWPERPDVGPGFMTTLATHLMYFGVRMFWVDGNHEDHRLLNPGSGTGMLRHLPRGFRWDWWGKTWMSVGGGVSVDKKFRTEGFDWFPEETLSATQIRHCCRPGKVDIIVSHDCPGRVSIPGLKYGVYPADAIADSEAHRGVIDGICDVTRPEWLFHGHYHVFYGTKVDDLNVVGLADSRAKGNAMVVTREDFGSGSSVDGDLDRKLIPLAR